MSFRYFKLPWNNPLQYFAMGVDENERDIHLCFAKNFKTVAFLYMSSHLGNRAITVSPTMKRWVGDLPAAEPDKNFIEEYVREYSTPEKPMYRLPKNNLGLVLLRKIYCFHSGAYTESLCFMHKSGGILVVTDQSPLYTENPAPVRKYEISCMFPFPEEERYKSLKEPDETVVTIWQFSEEVEL